MPTFTLPWPTGLSANRVYEASFTRKKGGGYVPTGGRHVSERADAWRNEVIALVRQARQPLPEGELAVIVMYWAPEDKRQHDADNLLKFLVDSVALAYQIDDDRVSWVTSWRRERTKMGKIVVRIERFEDVVKLASSEEVGKPYG